VADQSRRIARGARTCGLEYTNSYLTFTDLADGSSHFRAESGLRPGKPERGSGRGSPASSRGSAAPQVRSFRVVLHPPCIEDSRRFRAESCRWIRRLAGHRAVTLFSSCCRPLRSSDRGPNEGRRRPVENRRRRPFGSAFGRPRGFPVGLLGLVATTAPVPGRVCHVGRRALHGHGSERRVRQESGSGRLHALRQTIVRSRSRPFAQKVQVAGERGPDPRPEREHQGSVPIRARFGGAAFATFDHPQSGRPRLSPSPSIPKCTASRIGRLTPTPLSRTSAKLSAAGGTSIFDALLKTCRDQFQRRPTTARRSPSLVTDGEDTTSVATFDDALRMAKNDAGHPCTFLGVRAGKLADTLVNSRGRPRASRTLADFDWGTGVLPRPTIMRRPLLPVFAQLQEEASQQLQTSLTTWMWRGQHLFIRSGSPPTIRPSRCTPPTGYYPGKRRAGAMRPEDSPRHPSRLVPVALWLVLPAPPCSRAATLAGLRGDARHPYGDRHSYRPACHHAPVTAPLRAYRIIEMQSASRTWSRPMPSEARALFERRARRTVASSAVVLPAVVRRDFPEAPLEDSGDV